MKKLRAITLVELLVAMAVFSILMTGVVKLIQPVQDTATKTKIDNYQKTNEETVVTYIGEQLRYANNILIAEQGAEYTTDAAFTVNQDNITKGTHKIESPKDAQLAFLGMGLKNQYGELLKPYGKNCAQFYHVIIWDGYGADSGKKTTNMYDGYMGRMLTAYNGLQNKDGTCTTIRGGSKGIYNIANTDFTTATSATKQEYLYLLFGRGYFGTADMYLKMNITDDGVLKLRCDSDYYYNAGNNSENKARGKFNSTSGNPTVGSYQLRNYNSSNSNIKFLAKTEHNGIEATRTKANIFYIIYTTEEDMNNIMYYEPTDGDKEHNS